jgi:tRNA threonylcarbamoyladenosine biosynthesis protein TsaE
MTTSHGIAETIELGRQLAARLKAGDVVALSGELGAGKTCLVKGIAAGLRVAQEVTSPTFTLIHEYRGGRCALYHIDLYRLDSARQVLAIGIEDYLNGDGVTVIEWAEKIEALLPERAIHIKLSVVDETTRRIEIR